MVRHWLSLLRQPGHGQGPGRPGRDPTKPTGGNVIGHASTYRVYLRKSGENRIAKMIDSPYHPYSEVRFTVNEKGADNLDESKKSKK